MDYLAGKDIGIKGRVPLFPLKLVADNRIPNLIPVPVQSQTVNIGSCSGNAYPGKR
jgi:hypothetical protein